MKLWLASLRERVGQGTIKQFAIINGVPIGPQRNNWSCGLSALRHCLLSRGINTDVQMLSKWAGATRAGVGEVQLDKASRRAGCVLRSHMRRSEKSAERLLRSRLKRGVPLILCVERWSHWIAAVGCGPKSYLIIDSSRPGPVIKLVTWKWLERKLRQAPSRKLKEIFNHDKRPAYFVMELTRPVQRSSR